jgi:GNAT superfamily N-acetyltransferase
MKTHVKPLIAENYKSVKDIYDSEFAMMGKKTLKSPWKNRIPDLSLGIFNHSGDLLGFTLVIRLTSDSESNYLSRIAIHPDFQNFGLGKKLLKAVLEKSYLKKETLYLTPLNRSNSLIKFYCQQGFYGTGDGYMACHFYNTRRQSLFNRHHDPSPVLVPKVAFSPKRIGITKGPFLEYHSYNNFKINDYLSQFITSRS